VTDRIDRLNERNRASESGGGQQRIERQKADGKLTARERIAVLLDKDTFEELDKFVTHRCLDFGMQEQQYPGDGVVCHEATCEGGNATLLAYCNGAGSCPPEQHQDCGPSFTCDATGTRCDGDCLVDKDCGFGDYCSAGVCVQLLANGFKVIYDLAAQKVPATDNCTVVLKSYATAHKDVVQAYVDAEIEAIAAAKKDKQKTMEVLAKLLKLDVTKDKDALSLTYDFYVTSIIPAYPHVDAKTFQATRDTLVATNAKAKDFDVTKAIDDSFVADAEKRGGAK
jgi:hypothetical protein